MNKILISGYYGYGNAGDEAILCALIDGLRQTIPDVDLVVLSHDPLLTAEQYQVRAINRYNYLALIWELGRANLLISGGGSLLQDATGRWSIPYYTSIIRVAEFLKVPVMFFSQGVGPLTRPSLKKLVKRTLSPVTTLTVRDQQSLQLLNDLGLDHVQLTADPVFFLQPVSEQRIKEILIAERIPFNENGPWIGFNARPWENQEHYSHEIAIALDEIIKQSKAHIIMMPFQYQNDYEVMYEIMKSMKNKSNVFMIQKEYRADELLGICHQLDLMIGMRLHSLIFALRSGAIPIGISYDPKIDALLARFGREPVGNTAHLSSAKIVREFTEINDQYEALHAVIASTTKELEAEAWHAVQLAGEIILGGQYD